MNASRWTARLLLLGIVAAATACDNIDWGGAELAVVPPPPRGNDGEPEDDDGPRTERAPDGPLLYYLSASATQATVIPVAEIQPDTLVPLEAATDWEVYGSRLIGRHLREPTEFSVYRNGRRVGTFVLESAALPDERVCPRLPRGLGTLELAPGVARDGEFLALAKADSPDARGRWAIDGEADRTMQRMAPILAERMLRARRAPLPGDWQRAMAQIRPFPLADDELAAFAATFLVGDTLAPRPAETGWSLFFIGEPAPQVGFDTVFVRFTENARTGKAAPRVVDFLDWNGNGHAEILLQVYGDGDAWFEAVARVNGQWRDVFTNRCARPSSPAVPAEGDESAIGGSEPR